jgi:competence protein ComEC
MIETHHDADHYGGLDNVADDGRFAIYQHLTNQSVLPSVGDTLFFSPTVKGVILHYGDLPGETGTEENDRSIVIKMIFGNFEMILTGDIGEDAESVILERDLFDPTEKYEILKVAHHGSRYSSSAPFLNAVLPVISIISSGAGNDYGHPHPEALERLSAINSEILRTDQNSER